MILLVLGGQGCCKASGMIINKLRPPSEEPSNCLYMSNVHPRPFQCVTSCDNKFGARDPKCRLFLTRYVYWNILDRLFHIDTAMAATPFQADRQNAVYTQKKLHARQTVENREEEGCVYTIPLFDLIGKLLELKYIRSTRAHLYNRLSL